MVDSGLVAYCNSWLQHGFGDQYFGLPVRLLSLKSIHELTKTDTRRFSSNPTLISMEQLHITVVMVQLLGRLCGGHLVKREVHDIVTQVVTWEWISAITMSFLVGEQ